MSQIQGKEQNNITNPNSNYVTNLSQDSKNGLKNQSNLSKMSPILEENNSKSQINRGNTSIQNLIVI